MNHWVRLKRIEVEGEVMFEARCDIFPDVAGFGTAEEAYDAVCEAIDGLLPDMAKRACEHPRMVLAGQRGNDDYILGTPMQMGDNSVGYDPDEKSGREDTSNGRVCAEQRQERARLLLAVLKEHDANSFVGVYEDGQVPIDGHFDVASVADVFVRRLLDRKLWPRE